MVRTVHAHETTARRTAVARGVLMATAIVVGSWALLIGAGYGLSHLVQLLA